MTKSLQKEGIQLGGSLAFENFVLIQFENTHCKYGKNIETPISNNPIKQEKYILHSRVAYKAKLHPRKRILKRLHIYLYSKRNIFYLLLLLRERNHFYLSKQDATLIYCNYESLTLQITPIRIRFRSAKKKCSEDDRKSCKRIL